MVRLAHLQVGIHLFLSLTNLSFIFTRWSFYFFWIFIGKGSYSDGLRVQTPTQNHDNITGPGPQNHEYITGPGPQNHENITGPGPQNHANITGSGLQNHENITGSDPQNHESITGPGPQNQENISGPGPQNTFRIVMCTLALRITNANWLSSNLTRTTCLSAIAWKIPSL